MTFTKCTFRLIEYINTKHGVEWLKMEDICDDFKANNPPAKGALIPAEHGAILKDPGESVATPAFLL